MRGIPIRKEDGRLYILLPRDLSEEIAALAAFKGSTLGGVVQDVWTVGLAVMKNEDIMVCRVDEAGIHTEIDLEGSGL